MLRHRVMVNDLKRGTGVKQDNLSEAEAKALLKKLRRANEEGKAYFTQTYEEARTK